VNLSPRFAYGKWKQLRKQGVPWLQTLLILWSHIRH
jgi:hypothetical protein